MITGVAPNCETLLSEEILLLSIRERRMMERINACRESPDGLMIAETIRDEEKREFDNPGDERGGQANAELPGHAYTLTTRMESALHVILRVEKSLTRCQALKHRYIWDLIKLWQTKSDGAEVDEAIRLEVESMIASMVWSKSASARAFARRLWKSVSVVGFAVTGIPATGAVKYESTCVFADAPTGKALSFGADS